MVVADGWLMHDVLLDASVTHVSTKHSAVLGYNFVGRLPSFIPHPAVKPADYLPYRHLVSGDPLCCIYSSQVNLLLLDFTN